jgi:hypothetical protein
MCKPAPCHGNVSLAQMSRTTLTFNSRVQMDNRLPQPSSQPFIGGAPSATPQPASSSSSHTSYHTQTAQPPVQMPFSDPFHTRDPFMPSSNQHARRDSSNMGPAGPAMGSQYERAWSTQPQAPGTSIESLSFLKARVMGRCRRLVFMTA